MHISPTHRLGNHTQQSLSVAVLNRVNIMASQQIRAAVEDFLSNRDGMFTVEARTALVPFRNELESRMEQVWSRMIHNSLHMQGKASLAQQSLPAHAAELIGRITQSQHHARGVFSQSAILLQVDTLQQRHDAGHEGEYYKALEMFETCYARFCAAMTERLERMASLGQLLDRAMQTQAAMVRQTQDGGLHIDGRYGFPLGTYTLAPNDAPRDGV